MRSRQRGFSLSRRRTVQQTVLPLALLLIAGTIAIYLILRSTSQIIPDDDSARIIQAWESGDYREVVELSDSALETQPLDPMLLLYNGVSNFYHGVTLVNHDERQSALNSALFSLKKLLHSPPPGYEDEIRYVLGKVYFHKGSFYYDNAEKYLQAVLDSGFEADDIHEYLGVIYIDFGFGERGIEYILRAIETEPRDILFYTAAREYERLGDYQRALTFYNEAQDMTDDSFLSQEISIGQGRILFKTDRLADAAQIFSDVIVANDQAAEAFFYLGEIFLEQGDLVKARANWRNAYNQDRTFTPALERLESQNL